MMQELRKFYEKLEAEKAEIEALDVESVVAERLARVAETIREEVAAEKTTKSTVVAIKMEAIADAIKVIESIPPAVAENTTNVEEATATTVTETI